MIKLARPAAACAALAGSMGSAMAAAPSSTPANTVEEIVVTGVRASVENALEQKQNAMQMVDAIVAEDIGKLPDNSVSEAVQRIPGVQIARARGDANLVLIRGLPDLVTTINGRQIFSARGATPADPTAGRSVSLADIPADLLKQVQVFKTQTPDQFSGGLVGTINVDLRRPFDFDGFEVAGAARGIYSDETDEIDPIASGLISNRWNTDAGEFGAMISASYQGKNYLEANTFDGTYDLVDNPTGVATPGNPADDVYRPFVIGSIYTVGETVRQSSNFSLQWRPNDNATFYLDGFYAKYDEDYALNFWIPLPGISVTSYTLKPGTNVAQTWNSSDIFTLTSNQAFARESETYQVAIGGEIKVTDDLSVTSDLAYTKSKASNRDAILDTAFIAPRLIVDFSQGGASNAYVTNADGSPFDVTDSSHYFLNQLFDQHDDQQGDDVTFTTNLKYTLDGSFFKGISAGVQIGTRTAENRAANGAGIPIPAGPPVFVDDVEGITGIPGIQDVSPDGILSGDRDLATTRWFIPNREWLLGNTPELREIFGVSPETPPNDPTKFFGDTEDTYAAFVSTNFEFDAGSVPIDGVIGGRFVKIDSELGYFESATATSQSTFKASNDQFLPGLNVRAQFTDSLQLRLAASETFNRPAFASLNPSTNLRQSNGPTLPGQGDGGNPNLEDPQAKNVDLSLEWYFGQGSAVSGAVFHRDIDGYIQSFNAPEVYNGVTYQVTRPRNTDAKLKGAEFSYTQFYEGLPGWLSGFGTQLNYTYVDATAQIPDLLTSPVQFYEGPVTNVSKNAYNIILIYEKFGLSSRLAYNWRDEYIESYNQSGAQPPKAVVVKDAAQLDFSLGYKVNDKVTVQFDATNLLDEVVINYFGGRSAQDAYLYPRDVRSNDTTYSLGVRFRY
jgi:TonB-dependent receptor